MRIGNLLALAGIAFAGAGGVVDANAEVTREQAEKVKDIAEQAAAEALVPDSDAWYEALMTYDESIDKPEANGAQVDEIEPPPDRGDGRPTGDRGPKYPVDKNKKLMQDMQEIKRLALQKNSKEGGGGGDGASEQDDEPTSLNIAIERQISEIKKWNEWRESRSQGLQKLLQMIHLRQTPATVDQLRQELLEKARGTWRTQLKTMIGKVQKNAKPAVAAVFKAYTQQYLSIAPLSYDTTFLEYLKYGQFRNAQTIARKVIQNIDLDLPPDKINKRAKQLVNLLKVKPSLLQGQFRNNVMTFIDAKATAGLKKATMLREFNRNMMVSLSIYTKSAIKDLGFKPTIKVITTETNKEQIMRKLRDAFDTRLENVERVDAETLNDWKLAKEGICEIAWKVAKESDATLYKKLEQAAVDDRAMKTLLQNIYYGKTSGIQTKADKHDRDNELLTYGLLITVIGGLIILGVASAKIRSRSGGASGGTNDQALRMIEKTYERNRKLEQKSAERDVAMFQTKIDDLIVKAGEDVMGNAAVKMFYVRRGDFYRQIRKTGLQDNGRNTYASRHRLRLNTKEKSYDYLKKNGYEQVIGHIRDDEKAVELF